MPASVDLRASAGRTLRTGTAELAGRRVVHAQFDLSTRQGALSPADGVKLASAIDVALDQRLPFVATVASSGADLHGGVESLHAWGQSARAMARASGIIPLLVALDGPAVSGPALLLGLADHVVMTPEAYAFVSGPRMVRQFTGMPVTATVLGGAGAHERASGVAAGVAADLDEAMVALGELLGYLPDHCDALPARLATDDPAVRPTPEAGALLPTSPTGSYDVRDVIRCIADDAAFTELRAGWAPNLVTGFATIEGRPIGIVANQPCQIAGTLDIPSSQKGARFVAFCDAFNLGLLTLVDTPGFYPGKDLEWRGMIRHGAQLAFAYARATVPRVNLTMRKSYGGAYIVMDSRTMGNDVALAWPSAEIAVMGAKGAVEILHRGISPQERTALEAEYDERLLNPWVAAARGLIDAVIDPADTRRAVAEAFATLDSKAELLGTRAHDNMPL
ncbi:MAG: carboxyl transferase domain-containing protein [Acidimicrobiales bacterium]